LSITPSVFAEPFAGPLPISTDFVAVVAGQVLRDDADTYCDPAEVVTNVVEVLGHTPVWPPVSRLVRNTLVGVTLTDDDWIEIIDNAIWRKPPPDDDAELESQPQPEPDPDRGERTLVIGRHSRPDPLKWPGDADVSVPRRPRTVPSP